MPQIDTNLTSDDADLIQDSLSGVLDVKGKGKRGKNRDKDEMGGKTFREIRKDEVENSQGKRRDEAEREVLKTLEHFPKSEHQETIDKNITKYTKWLLESLKLNEPVINTYDLEFSQFSAGGPGGQNVNKVSNAVFYKHLVTGLFANSRDSRNTIENRNHAAKSLYEDLGVLVKNWKVILSDISSNRWEDAIRTFIKKTIEEK